MAHEHINDYFNGRPFLLLCSLAMVAVSVMAVAVGVQPHQVEETGLLFKVGDGFFSSRLMSAAANVLALLMAGFFVLGVNKVFTFVRSMTHLVASAFFLLMIANPAALVSFNAGTLLCLVTAMSLMTLFASYQDSHSQRSIFLIFALLATGAMFRFAFVLLVPCALLGFINMRVMGSRGVLAMLIGLVTPFWIVFGLGIASPADIVLPHFDGLWTMEHVHQSLPLYVLSAACGLLGIVLALMNLFTVLNYRQQPRVYNIFLMLLLVMVVIIMCLDGLEMAVFLPLLSLMVAVQIAQIHSLRKHSLRFVFLLLLIAACVASCAYQLLMP